MDNPNAKEPLRDFLVGGTFHIRDRVGPVTDLPPEYHTVHLSGVDIYPTAHHVVVHNLLVADLRSQYSKTLEFDVLPDTDVLFLEDAGRVSRLAVKLHSQMLCV